MDIADHYALRSGTAPMPDGALAALTVYDLGTLRVASGKLGACDPFVALDDPLVVPIPPGEYPVKITLADVSAEQDGSHLREAYLSIVLSDRPSTSVEPAPSLDGPPEDDELFGVGVDAGTVAFVDADAIERCMPEDDSSWYDEVFESDEPGSWFEVMDADGPHRMGSANVVMPRATDGESVALTHSGWGDGFYPLVQTKDAEGNVTAVHIDLLVVGNLEDDDEDDE